MCVLCEMGRETGGWRMKESLGRGPDQCEVKLTRWTLPFFFVSFSVCLALSGPLSIFSSSFFLSVSYCCCCCLWDQDWAGCFLTDYLDSERTMFKQRVIQTVLFDPQAKQNNHDSRCLRRKSLLIIAEPGLHPATECAGNCKNTTSRLWVAQRKTHKHTHLDVQDIVQVFPQQYIIWLG